MMNKKVMIIKVDGVRRQEHQLADRVVVLVWLSVGWATVRKDPRASRLGAGQVCVCLGRRRGRRGTDQAVSGDMVRPSLGVRSVRSTTVLGRAVVLGVVQIGVVIRLGMLSTAWIGITVSSSPR